MEWRERRWLSVFAIFLSSGYSHAQNISGAGQAPGPDAFSAPSPFAMANNGAYANINAPTVAINVYDSCETATYTITKDDLIGLDENDCAANSTSRPYGRDSPFGFTWTDQSGSGCSITSVTILLQPGVSCAGNVSATQLNGYVTPTTYKFPYTYEYDDGIYNRGECQCPPPPTAEIQVFNFEPNLAYNQNGNNTFLIQNSTGDNGLSELIPNATDSLYGLVIVNQWQRSRDMIYPRSQFGYSLMGNGRILAAGGVTNNSNVTDTAEEYDIVSDQWTLTRNNLSKPRQMLQMAPITATTDNRGAYYILVSGGYDQNGTVLATADTYNTSSRTWTPAPPMLVPRTRHTLTPVFNNTKIVIAVGGLKGSNTTGYVPLSSAERFSWTGVSWNLSATNMTYARSRHQSVLLNSSSMLIIGGQGESGAALSSVEMLALEHGNFSQMAPLLQARYAFTATLLKNGSVLVAGGAQLPNVNATWQTSQLLYSCELYTNGVWTQTGSLTYPRAAHQAALLDDGNVLVMGGGGADAQQASEVYNVALGYWITVAPLPEPKVNFGVAPGSGGRVLTFGGSVNSTVTFMEGTSSAYYYSSPFSTSELAYFLQNNSSGPAMAPAPLADVYRSPPATNAIPVQTAYPDVQNNPNINQIFAGAPLPSNSTINFTIAENGLSGGAIGGIVGGCVGVILLVLLGVIWFLMRRRRLRRKKRYSPEGLEKIAQRFGSGSIHHHSCDAHRTSSKSLGGFGSTPGISQKSLAVHNSNSVHTGQKEPKSVKLPFRAIASPFGFFTQKSSKENTTSYATEHVSNTEHGNNGDMYMPKSVQMPRGLASPFSSEPASMRSQYSGGGLKSLKSIDEQSTTGDSASPEAYGSYVNPLASTNERSVSSDLSRVSVQIKNELVAADWKIDRSALLLEKRLGKGGFGEVFRGQHHGSPVAVKVLEINDERTLLDACQEFGHLHNLRHSKLVVSYGACIQETSMMLVMELMEEDLFHAIANDSTGSGDSVLWNFRGWQIAVDVASALVFLHSKGLVHLDVKTLNILLRGRRTEAKLGDLGLAKLVPDGHLALQATLPGTPAYSAPEVMQAQLSWRLRTQGRKDQFRTSVGTPADIFSFGVVLFEICTGQHPARWRQDFQGTFRPDQAPPEIAKLVDDCLNDEPEQRPTARQVLDTLLKNKPKNLR